MLRVIRYPDSLNQDTVVTLGKFDGFHLGHQELIKRTLQKAKELELSSCLYSFYKNPLLTLRPGFKLELITTHRQRIALLNSFGVQYFYLQRFTRDFAEQSARVFLEKILVQQLRCKHLVVGSDAKVGRQQEGSIQVIQEILAEHGVSVSVVDFLHLGETKVSSSRLRSALAMGDCAGFKELANRNFEIQARVEYGAGRGKELNFPTANLKVGDYCLPKSGVYTVWAHLNGQRYQAVCNIGHSPTVKNTAERTLEVFLINYQGADFYREYLSVEFVDYLRPEQKFSDIQALQIQIKEDVDLALKTLQN